LLANAGARIGGPFFVAGVWRDYVRQTGAVAMDLATTNA
jgi:hypothetical protein